MLGVTGKGVDGGGGGDGHLCHSFICVTAGMSGNDFCAFGNGNGNKKYFSQNLGMGTGNRNTVPNIRERDLEILFPIFENGNGNGKWQPISQNIGEKVGKA